MASNIKAHPERNMRGASEIRDMSLPLLDLSDAAVKELIRSAKKRGHVTVDQINAVLPSKEAYSEEIKDILSIFGEMGVNVVEIKEAEPEEDVATREEPVEEDEAESELVVRTISCVKIVDIPYRYEARAVIARSLSLDGDADLHRLSCGRALIA